MPLLEKDKTEKPNELVIGTYIIAAYDEFSIFKLYLVNRVPNFI